MAGVDESRKPFVLSSVDHELLLVVSELHYLTAEQILRLRYSRASLTYVRSRLKRLADNDFLQRTWAVRPTPFGKPPTVYRLGRAGISYLKEAGYGIEVRYRPSEHVMHADGYLSHALAVTEVLIAAKLLARQVPQITVQAMRHDLDLKRSPIPVSPLRNGPGELQTVVPDGWIDLVVADSTTPRHPILLEVDRGTENVASFKRKIRAMIALLKGPYHKVFGTKFGRIAVVVDTAAFVTAEAAVKRVKDLCRWAHEELKAHKQDGEASRWHFGLLPRGYDLSPRAFFLGPSWIRPGFAQPVSLLAVPESGVERGSSDDY